ncbi:hypothetical protein [Butyrivibrio sp. INlla14]|uniref:hypothetical protein n=1 Tax=Butyrivibrio sp. INlla14 TaxID=1520808 RepID=UPI000876D158|nr:hypothetical protein [Butyrivibrio sp. INlla14]SCY10941.1 hypothetical protein SAMN02910371_01096 [Butyrivibrio sp. INlla14]
MKELCISIELDPVKDGISFGSAEVTRPDAHAVIIGTNGQVKQISMSEAVGVINALDKCGSAFTLGSSDYSVIYNKTKVFMADLQDYLVGSVLIMHYDPDNGSLSPVYDMEIGELMELFEAQLDTLRSGDVSFAALRIG